MLRITQGIVHSIHLHLAPGISPSTYRLITLRACHPREPLRYASALAIRFVAEKGAG